MGAPSISKYFAAIRHLNDRSYVGKIRKTRKHMLFLLYSLRYRLLKMGSYEVNYGKWQKKGQKTGKIVPSGSCHGTFMSLDMVIPTGS